MAKKPKPIKRTVVVKGVRYWRSLRELAVAEKRQRKRQPGARAKARQPLGQRAV